MRLYHIASDVLKQLPIFYRGSLSDLCEIDSITDRFKKARKRLIKIQKMTLNQYITVLYIKSIETKAIHNDSYT